MRKRTEANFLTWLAADMKFYVGWARYCQFGNWDFVIAACCYGSDELECYINNLEGDDFEGLSAAKGIRKMENDGDCWIGHDRNPVIGMTKCVEKIRKYYFEVLK